MEVTKESLEKRFSIMDFDDLMRIKEEGNLTEIAIEVMEAELCRRATPEYKAAQERDEAEKERKQKDYEEKLVGIKGWLILPAIGFVLGPLIGVVGLITSIGMYSDFEGTKYGGIYALELIVSTGLTGLLIYAAVLFFQKRKNAPRVIIKFLTLSIVASCILLVIELGGGFKIFAIETGKQLVFDLINAAIWIPIWKNSMRVKATFVR